MLAQATPDSDDNTHVHTCITCTHDACSCPSIQLHRLQAQSNPPDKPSAERRGHLRSIDSSPVCGSRHDTSMATETDKTGARASVYAASPVHPQRAETSFRRSATTILRLHSRRDGLLPLAHFPGCCSSDDGTRHGSEIEVDAS
ncbi:uncharacterized protein B0H64DRAFT_398501 [Chaetomium fimeti]|uniref:Uncharacterized protein n=1 Tax=Chaetomium fimeti TaxID=1854472 RepID=A0AAE0LT41_9PEZI|nr:hypothetical protein B0H64DRAFT_398501 [Chaetomium fimeti]